MAILRPLRVLVLSCAFGVPCFAVALVAEPAGQRAALPAGPHAPKITTVKVLELQTLGELAPCQDKKISRRAGPPHRGKAPAAEPCVDAIASPGTRASFRLAIIGANLSPTTAPPEVNLDTEDAGHPVPARVAFHDATEIDVSGEAPVPTTIKRITVSFGPCAGAAGAMAPEAACQSAVSPRGLSISIKANPPQQLKEFQVKLEHRANKEFPNLHSLLVTRQSGDTGAGFDARASRMQVDLEPTGASDLTIVQSNEQVMALHFVAAADYVPKNVVVTVYDKSDLESRVPVAVAKLAPAKPPEDPNAPKIDNVEIAFLDRTRGQGRIQIYGKGFGKLDRPGYPVDDYLCDCLERPTLSGYRGCSHLGDVKGPTQVTHEANGSDDKKIKQERAREELAARQGAVELRDKSALRQAEIEEARYIQALAEAAAKRGSLDPRDESALGQAKLDEERFRKALAETAAKKEPETPIFCAAFEPAWTRFQESLRGRVTVGVNSRNPAIRVERVYIIDFNDERIDVYFEFTRHWGYAWPFRLSGIDLTVTKEVEKVEQAVKADAISAAVEVKGPATFTAAQSIGPKPDPNLTYEYTVLDFEGAKSQLGSGVADNFYVLQLSVVNHGKKKVSIPLASIQAEVEWRYGDGKVVHRVKEFYMAGPPTLAPMPLAAVSAFFGMYQKSEGRRVRVFNILDGITTLATALVPFTAPAFKDAEVVLSGGFIPGLRQAWVDLSAQQLQNLTSLSWETSETVASNGGSIEKFIYIQRKPQFSDRDESLPDRSLKNVKQIANIMDLEVTGFEVPDAPEKQATPATAKPAATQTAPKAPSGSDQPTDTPPASPAPDGEG
jgi:hypothetical protein